MALYEAMEAIEIAEKERKDRNITFHSRRHFFDTYLRAANITDNIIQAVTGTSRNR
jgi:integrase